MERLAFISMKSQVFVKRLSWGAAREWGNSFLFMVNLLIVFVTIQFRKFKNALVSMQMSKFMYSSKNQILHAAYMQKSSCISNSCESNKI